MRCFHIFADNANRLNQLNNVIGKSMYLNHVCVYNSSVTAYCRKVKTGFTFFDEVFHLASFAVKFNEVFRLRIHVCNNEGIQVNHLVFWLFHLAYNVSFVRPWASFVHELTVNHSVNPPRYFESDG